MPQVPTYGPSQTVETAPLRSVRQRTLASGQTLGAGGAQMQGTGRALNQVGDVLQVRAMDLQRRENLEMVQRADTAAADEYLEFERGVRERRGRDALGATAETDQWWAEADKRHTENLANDTQIAVFREQLARRRQSSIGQISNFESTEARRSFVEASNAAIVSNINTAAAHFNDPAALGMAYENIEASIAALAKSEGWSEEVVAAETEKHLTNFHSQVIKAQIDTRPKEARAYYDANQDEIAGTARRELEKALEIGGLKMRSQEATDKIMDMGLGKTAALAYARENYAGEERDAVVTRVAGRYNEQEAGRAQREKDASKAAWSAYRESGFSIDAVPPSALDGMDPEAAVRFMEYARVRAETNSDIKTQWPVYKQLVDMSINDPKKFTALNIDDYRTVLSEEHYDKIEARYESAIESGLLPPDEFTTTQIISNAMKRLELTGQANDAASGELTYIAQKAVNDAQAQQPGKPLGDEEERLIVDKAIYQAIVENPDKFAPKPETLSDIRTTTQQINTGKNFLLENYDGDEDKAANLFEAVATEALREKQQAMGADLTEMERQEVIDQLLTYGQVDGSGWFRDDRVYLFEIAQDNKAVQKFVPE